MIKIIKVTDPDCFKCFGASFGDCETCAPKMKEIAMCKDCAFKDDDVMHREKLLCTKLHAWVEPCDFCAWGERIEE